MAKREEQKNPMDPAAQLEYFKTGYSESHKRNAMLEQEVVHLVEMLKLAEGSHAEKSSLGSDPAVSLLQEQINALEESLVHAREEAAKWKKEAEQVRSSTSEQSKEKSVSQGRTLVEELEAKLALCERQIADKDKQIENSKRVTAELSMATKSRCEDTNKLMQQLEMMKREYMALQDELCKSREDQNLITQKYERETEELKNRCSQLELELAMK